MTTTLKRLVRVVRKRTAPAIQTLAGGPPPRLVIAPHLYCPSTVLALRSTRRPLSNHPDRPLALLADHPIRAAPWRTMDGTPEWRWS